MMQKIDEGDLTMDLILLNDGLYHLVEVTKEMTKGITLLSEANCFDLCDILRLKRNII